MPVYDLASLPANTEIFVDANIFIYHFNGKSATCTAFVERIANDDVMAYVNTQVLSDLLHKLMCAEAVAKRLITNASADKMKKWLAANRAAAAKLRKYQAQFEYLLGIGVKVMPVTRKTLVDSKRDRAAHALMIGDSLNICSMGRNKPRLSHIATRDGDFGHISTLTVWQPQDVIP